jgi:hypothetical protein
MRSAPATSVGVWASRRVALRRLAASPLSPTSGSTTPSMETWVRSTSMGSAVAGAPSAIFQTAGSGSCSARIWATSPLSWSALGSSPFQSRYAVSSNDECSARSTMS